MPLKGSPPHTRGILVNDESNNVGSGITPAHAGNTDYIGFFFRRLRDHPRTRGEYPFVFIILLVLLGSPPHTRGIRSADIHIGGLGGITPAHAGNTQDSQRTSTAPRDHPRTRGEYISDQGRAITLEGSPPHTRGILLSDPDIRRSGGITPAHAGNTCGNKMSFRPIRDHPRTRGEYERCFFYQCQGKGSPPHTRGILYTEIQRMIFFGITPAHAGNTPPLSGPVLR